MHYADLRYVSLWWATQGGGALMKSEQSLRTKLICTQNVQLAKTPCFDDHQLVRNRVDMICRHRELDMIRCWAGNRLKIGSWSSPPHPPNWVLVTKWEGDRYLTMAFSHPMRHHICILQSSSCYDTDVLSCLTMTKSKMLVLYSIELNFSKTQAFEKSSKHLLRIWGTERDINSL